MTAVVRAAVARALRADYRGLWFAAGRSTLALATASELIFTHPAALFTRVGPVRGPLCAPHSASLFCLGQPHDYLDARRWIAIAALLLVASGYKPRLTAIVHLWIVFSVSTTITLPDGGDAIALIVVLLITPMCLADPRRWQWSAVRTRMTPTGRALAYLSFWALRLQIAYLYADSAIAKMGVADWQNGSAFYYFVRDKMFGSAGVTAPLWLWLSNHTVTTLAVTWGTIMLELAIALFTLLDARWRMIAFWLCAVLHTLIFLSMGLCSFSLVMIGAAALTATCLIHPPRRPPHTRAPADRRDPAAGRTIEASGR
ncbi:sporulation-delaying protein SdpB family protein [Mycobacterium sp.]|uniref:sporulation-delaying protein SdpB family protein n=1 Tax=Mycobacterium sp. TaxID=1785 RepID=UPI0025F79074|nr:sporulation-delaying protein SdpB family protein [Mycobacterium sp.]